MYVGSGVGGGGGGGGSVGGTPGISLATTPIAACAGTATNGAATRLVVAACSPNVCPTDPRGDRPFGGHGSKAGAARAVVAVPDRRRVTYPGSRVPTARERGSRGKTCHRNRDRRSGRRDCWSAGSHFGAGPIRFRDDRTRPELDRGGCRLQREQLLHERVRHVPHRLLRLRVDGVGACRRPTRP